MTRLATVILRTTTPCRCRRPIRIQAILGVPRQVQFRRCAACGTVWDVERRTASEVEGRRVDVLEWTPRPALA